jgi:hypothetical protein
MNSITRVPVVGAQQGEGLHVQCFARASSANRERLAHQLVVADDATESTG